ncbi:hemolysin III family protein [Desulfogranum marinum]|jgi:hemolysin III|uniref:PAQR family membrane homeostasis protein TrhA n=1 Tax=Desulfogranum marinum TaxID=453220 RepID=UPI001964B0AF|nr:hemolysin III family protein [Desulfogranum marinum]MBM9511528.1 hemolysin III family protein [Desulfogranum marinum]
MYKGEKFNSISHLAGSIAAIIGLVVLIVTTGRQGEVLPIVSVTIYGITLVLLYVFSTLNHSLRGKAKYIFQKLDFLAIYLLIAGTYTPFALITLRGGLGWTIFGLVWGLAILGIILELFHHAKNRSRSIIIYLVMGWVILLAIKPLVYTIGISGFCWLLLGGLFYTCGVFFYVNEDRVKHFHGIWHLCVLAGSTTQYFTVFYYVL